MSRYKIILLSNDTGERLEVKNSPIGWDKIKFNVIRDFTYFGIFKSLSVEFRFQGDGYEFLQQHKLRYGVDASILIRVYKRQQFLFEGKINFARHKDIRKSRHFQVDIIQSGFVQKFQTRENIKLNIFNSISLDRNIIQKAATVDATVRGKVVQFYSDLRQAEQTDPEIYHHIIPVSSKVSGNPNVPDFVYDQKLDNNPETLKTPDNAIYKNTTTQIQSLSTIKFKLDATIKVISPVLINFGIPGQIVSNRFRWRLQIYRLDSEGDPVFVSNIMSKMFEVNSGTVNVTHSYSGFFDIAPGEYIIAVCERIGQRNNSVPPAMDFEDVFLDEVQMSGTGIQKFRSEITYNKVQLILTEDSIEVDSQTKAVLPHELFTNLVAQVTGIDNAFYSEFFGREDLGYEADGEGAYLAITKGELLRGVELEPVFEQVEGLSKTRGVQLITSMQDAYVSYSSVFNLGILIQGNKIIIEPKDKLINGNVSIDLGEVNNLETKPAIDFLFNSVKAGYPSNEYEEENGRDEFNTEVQYTNSLISVEKDFDLRSVYCGDGYGIEFARRERISKTGNKDSRYDEKIFFIDLIRAEDGSFITRRLEGIDELSGVFSPATSINARIAPGQNMLRHQRFLAIPLHRKADRSYYFQAKNKNNNLKITTALGTSDDGEDLPMEEPAYFLPEERAFNTPITVENLLAFLANPLGLVRYTYEGETFRDLLFEVNSETETANSEWRMLGTKATPIDSDENATDLAALKYNDGLTDYIKYGDGDDDIILYQ